MERTDRGRILRAFVPLYVAAEHLSAVLGDVGFPGEKNKPHIDTLREKLNELVN